MPGALAYECPNCSSENVAYGEQLQLLEVDS
jgi:hypothetical protein